MDGSEWIRGFRTKPLSYAEIEFHAVARRYAMGLHSPMAVRSKNLLNIVENDFRVRSREHRVLYRVECRAVSRDYLGGAEARTVYNHRDICFEILLSEEAYRGIVNGEPHFLFTLAHELGHLFLHHDWLLAETSYQLAGVRGSPPEVRDHEVFEDTEWQADAFAGAFLMPAHLISRLDITSPRTLSGLCGTSIAAATTRLDIYGAFEGELLAASKVALRVEKPHRLERAASAHR